MGLKPTVKCWVKEPSKLKQTPNHVYKMKSSKKAYQFFIIFACRIYGQENTMTFLEGWVVRLDQLVSD